MEIGKLKASLREEAGKKLKSNRKDGRVPAVIYGKGMKNKNLWVDFLALNKFIDKHGEGSVIELEIDGKEKHNVIINESQIDPIRDSFVHIDFLKIKMDEVIETEVELDFVGESAAVKNLGGTLIRNMDEIEVKCLPADLPSEIKVDVSVLKTFEDRISVGDLPIPEKVEIKLDPETMVAYVAEPRSQEELEELEEKVEEDVTQVEGVEKEGDEESEEGEAKDEKKEEAKEEKPSEDKKE